MKISIMVTMAACGLWCNLARGDDPFSVLPEPGKLAGYVSHADAGKWVVFQSDPFRPVQPTLVNDGKGVIWQGDAGQYGVIYFPSGDEQPLVRVVELGADSPDPDPDPDPPPPPPDDRWGIIVEETADRTPEQAALWSRVTRQTTLRELMIVDQGSQAASLDPYLDAVESHVREGGSLPALVVISSDDGSVIDVLDCPDTVDSIKEVLGL